jgi:AcrR family transcriptional regulator
MPKGTISTRDRIISAATALYYDEGIRSASIDSIAAKAGVTKRTLYYHFRSKDDLVAAYLEARDQPTLALYARWFDETVGPASKKIEGMFQKFARAARSPKWKGCGFLRTSAELASTPGHPAVKAGAAHKKNFEAWLSNVLAGEGIEDPELVARKIVVLLDGAASVMLIHRDPAYVEAAGAVAASLVMGKK